MQRTVMATTVAVLCFCRFTKGLRLDLQENAGFRVLNSHFSPTYSTKSLRLPVRFHTKIATARPIDQTLSQGAYLVSTAATGALTSCTLRVGAHIV